MNKLKLAIVCGGESVEHEISLASAKNIYNLVDRHVYEPSMIGITKKGEWFHLDYDKMLLFYERKKLFALDDHTELLETKVDLNELAENYDVAFPILHGTMGEDGSIQGLFKMLHIPCVGPGILDAALGMDKEVMKRLCVQAGIKVASFKALVHRQEVSYEECIKELGANLFIKPSNSGSSVGISKVTNKEEFLRAIDLAFQYDKKILIEEAIVCREIEIAVLGNQEPIASLPGEVIPHHEFYSYEAKYLDENGASFCLPAQLTEAQTQKVRSLALSVYKTAGCQGMARVDFFLDRHGEFYFNEINSIPGFTAISLYPKLWELTGLEPKRLISALIELALGSKDQERALASFAKEDLIMQFPS